MDVRTGSFRRPAAVATAALAILAPSGLAACGGDDDENDGEDAGGEVTLTVYSGRDEELVGPLLERYEEETGNELEVRYGESAELAATIVEEGENSPADVFFSQDAGSLGAIQNEGLLGELPDEVLETVDQAFRSSEDAWVGVSGRARVLAYNTDTVQASELPDSVLELTGTEWKGRVGWAPTNGSFQAFVTAMRLTEGEDAAADWLEGMVANETVALPDNEAARDAVAAGEVDLALINHYYVEQAREEEGDDYPVDVHFTSGGDVGSLVNVAGAGAIAGSDELDAATELVAFLLDQESQQFFSDETKEYPLVTGVEADPDLVPLAEIQQPEVDLSNLDDLQGTLRLIEDSGAL
ncbi:MAG: iron ABC transporter substrate-binding protein [Actinomycetota bacterium]|nr:iron ABC transporter substrate-binding protein [Actinomycetota bacterium]